MEKSNDIKELAEALSGFQSEMEFVGYDADNPFFKSRYATLTQLVSEAKKLVGKYGLSVSQLIEGEGGVTTILMHKSGQWMHSTCQLRPVIKFSKDELGNKYLPEYPDPQSVGSAITYSRRYAYAAILGLVSDEDDDANSATFQKKEETPPKEILRPTITLRGMIDKMGTEKFGNVDNFKAWRVNNGLPENLDGMKDFDLAKIMTAIREYKKVVK